MSATLRENFSVLRWLMLTASLTLAGCLSNPSTERGFAPARMGPVSDQRMTVVRVAGRMIGTPYRYGGNSPRGFDCSGLVQYTHAHAGLSIPRTTGEQWRYADRPRRRHLLPGDLVFFDLDGSKASHVGIYEGGGVFIHAPSSGKHVARASLDNPYWQNRMIGARTFL